MLIEIFLLLQKCWILQLYVNKYCNYLHYIKIVCAYLDTKLTFFLPQQSIASSAVRRITWFNFLRMRCGCEISIGARLLDEILTRDLVSTSSCHNLKWNKKLAKWFHISASKWWTGKILSWKKVSAVWKVNPLAR